MRIKVTVGVVALLAAWYLAGCGSAGNSNGHTPSPQGATMQTGQWEFVATPSSGGKPVYVEANFWGTNAAIGSYIYSTGLFQFGGQVGGQFSSCVGWQTSGDVVGNTFNDMLFSGTAQVGTASGTLDASGQSVSNGSYSSSTLCGLASNNSTGTFTGYTVAPLNGTFTGTLNGSSSGPDQITIQVSQDANYGITVSGTSVQAGVTTSLSIAPTDANPNGNGATKYSNVIGATVQASGTTSNVNGTGTFQVFGHINAAGTQIQIVSMGNSGTETGTLTKQ